MTILYFFTDGSVDPGSKNGFGAYFVLKESPDSIEVIEPKIEIRKFEDTSSTRLEVQTFLWAIAQVDPSGERVVIYTDCQNLIGLQGRRSRFESANYVSRKGNRLSNADLYQQFFEIVDRVSCQFIKVQGHKRTNKKDKIDLFFSFVDKASRKALRDYMKLKSELNN